LQQEGGGAAALRLDCVNKGGNTDMAKKLVSTLNGLSV